MTDGESGPQRPPPSLPPPTAGGPTLSPNPPVSGPAAAEPDPGKKPSWWRRKYAKLPVWAWGVGALVLLTVIAGVTAEEEPEDGNTEAVADTAEPTDAETEPTQEASDEPEPDETVPAGTEPPATEPPAATDAPQPATTIRATLPPQIQPVPAQAAVEQLAQLTIADPDRNRIPYRRDEYDGGGWGDEDGDCINTRHEVLLATSETEPTIADGCFADTGTWTDPYTGDVYTSARDVTIDHVVPLAEAHRSGAWRWDNDTKNRFANDQNPGHLAVVGPDVNQSKADNPPDRWMPPDPEAHCQYAIDWINSKHRYALTATNAERGALAAALETCIGRGDEIRGSSTDPAVVATTIATTTTTTTIAPSAGPGMIEVLSCDARAETVVIGNAGGEAVNLSGYVLHDEDFNHSTNLGGSLGPGEQVTYVSGDQPDPPGSIRWTGRNVWNNDGDTATIIRPDGSTSERACRT